MSNAKRSHHGNTPAAWTTVVIALAGFLVGGIGIVAASSTMFWAGVGLGLVSMVVGKVMQMAGLGQIRRS